MLLSRLTCEKSDFLSYHYQAILYQSSQGNSYPGGGDSTLIRRVCATSVLNLSPCSGVGKPKKDTLLWSYRSFLKSIVLYCIVLYCIVLYCIVLYCIVLYCIVLYCIVLYCIVLYCIVLYCIALHCIVLYCIALHCIVLETKIMFMLYLFNQMILPFPFSSVRFVQKSLKFSIKSTLVGGTY